MLLMENQQLICESNFSGLAKVEKLIDDICTEFKLNNDYFGNILIAVTEAVNNAIQYGNKKDATKKVIVDFEAKPAQLLFTITDEGKGFDFDNIPDPTSPENLEKPDGRGIFLMKHLADNVTFSKQGQSVQLSFTIPV